MRWIKASERLPEKEDNYFVKVQGIEYNNDNAEYTCGAFHHFVNTFEGKYFSSLPKHETVIEWLDESPDQPEPLPDSNFEQDFKELNRYLDILCQRGHNVKDSGHLWIEFTDKFNAFRKRVLAAASTVSEAGEDAIGFVEWIDKEEWLRMLPENTWVKSMEKADDVDAENYNTTEQLYQLYRKQPKQ